MPLALYTFGQFVERAEHKSNDGFYTLNDPVFELVDQAPGLVARSGYASDPGPEPWGQEVYPSFYKEQGDEWSPATLSLWDDMESLFVFTYFGLHAVALKRGHEWFQKPQWPPLALWWHGAETLPTWAQGVERHQHLHEHGSTPFAFTFKEAFDQSDNPVKINKTRIKALREKIEAGFNNTP